MNIPPSSQASNARLTLQVFQEAATHNTDVYLDGERLVLLGSGTTPQGRRIDWIAPSGDATAALSHALRDAVGSGLSNAIAHELGLSPAPGKPLSSRTIERAVEMAHEGQHALEGVDFMTRLQLSAQRSTPDFIRICNELSLDATQFDTATRKNIDDRLSARFETAAQSGHIPVSLRDAAVWLTEIMQDLSWADPATPSSTDDA